LHRRDPVGPCIASLAFFVNLVVDRPAGSGFGRHGLLYAAGRKGQHYEAE